MMEQPIRDVLDALPIAVLAFDADHRLAFVNARTYELAKVDLSAITTGATFEDVLRILAYRGFYGPGDPEVQVRAALAIDRRKPFRRLGQTTPGRWFEVASTPLPDGGFVAPAPAGSRPCSACCPAAWPCTIPHSAWRCTTRPSNPCSAPMPR